MRSRCFIPLAVAAASCLATAAAAFEVEVVTPGSETIEVTVRADDGRSDTREVVARAPGSVEVEIAPGRVWSFEAEGPAAWAPPQTIFVSEADRRVRLVALRAAPVSGRVTVPRGERRPDEVTLSAAPLPDDGAETIESPLERPCPVGAEGRFSCQLPVATFDFKLAAQGFLSHHSWGFRLDEQGLDLGEIALSPGASVVVEVRGEDDEPLSGASVQLYRGVEPRAGSDTGGRALRAKSNSRGIAILAPVDAGNWVVEVTKEGLTPARSPRITVLERTEVTLRDPVVLIPTTVVSVLVDPPSDPRGEPWKVALLASPWHGSSSDVVQPQTCDPEGWVDWGAVPRREVEVVVSDARGGLWHTETVDLRTAPQPIEVHLESVSVRGRVVEPSPASGALRWHASRRRSVPFSVWGPVDEDGSFSIALPRSGEWFATLDLAEGGKTPPIKVEVPEPHGDEPAEVELRFPAGVVAGRVLDSEGRAVAGATVMVAPPSAAALAAAGEPSTAMTDQDGRFRATSSPGKVMVTARSLEGATAMVETVVPSQGRVTVEIRLPRPGRIAGRVVQDGRPAPGVTLIALPVGPGAATLNPTLSDREGRFEVDVGSSGPAELIAIPARGGAVVEIVTPGQDEIVVSVPALSGRLEVTWDFEPARGPLLRIGPAMVPLQLLTMFTSGRGGLSSEGRLVVPALAPGRYEVCVPLQAGPAGGPKCRTAEVFPDGETLVSLTP